MIRTYNELITITTFEERFLYLKLLGIVGKTTFGFERHLNQTLYKSDRWQWTRDQIIIRDNACDLGILDLEIFGSIYVHHINPITSKDIRNNHPKIFDFNNLICTSFDTHQAIHFGNEEILENKFPINREPGDTKLW